MITLALLLAGAPAALVRNADEANKTYIECLFATSRAADANGLSVAEFSRRLAGACGAEEQRARAALTQVLAANGERNPAAAARQAALEARSSVAATYESLQQIGPQLEELSKLCREQPDACR
jgi:hypothetical protein